MKFKIDENLPSEVAADLRNLGHEADTVFDESLVGAEDPVLLAAASGRREYCLPWTKASRISSSIRPRNGPEWFCFALLAQAAAASSRSFGSGSRTYYSWI